MENSVQVRPYFSRVAPALVLAIVTLIMLKLFFLAQVLYFPTVNRVTYAQPYNTSLIGPAWDGVILGVLVGVTSLLVTRARVVRAGFGGAGATALALFLGQQFIALDILSIAAGFAFIAAILVMARKGQLRYRFDPRWLLISIMMAQGAVLVRWLAFPLYPTQIFGDWSWKLNEVYASLQGIASLLVPGILLLTVFSYVLVPNRDAIARAGRSLALHLAPGLKGNPDSRMQASRISRALTWRRLYVIIFTVSFVLPFYPYIPSINPGSQVVSVDAPQYQLWMEMLSNSGSPSEFSRLIFAEIQSGDRPLTLALIYGFYVATGQNAFATFVLLSPVLSLLLVASTYFLVGAFTQNAIYRNLAGIVAILSFQIITGLYIGFFSNWLALVLTNVSILFILKLLETRSPTAMAAMIAASLGILFVHATTWVYFAGATAIFLGMSAYADRKNSKMLLLLLLVAGALAAEFAIDQAKSLALGSSNTIALNSDITEQKLGASEFVLRWNNLRHLFTVYLWGTLANATLAMLALIWCVKAGLNDRLSRFVLAMFFVGSIPIVVGSFDVQSRFVYNMPFHIAAALLLGGYLEKRQFSFMSSLIVAAILLDLGVYFLRALANMYLIAPV